VLEVIDESLFGRRPSETAYEPRSAQERVWRVRATPLPEPGNPVDGEVTCRALVYFTDETDARRAERMRVDFLANASHELRTPLASLSGFIETLRGHAKHDPEAREQFLRIMTTQAERMSRLIDDLMSLSRIELNEHIPPSGACDLSMVVMDVADTLRPLTAEKKVKLDLRLPSREAAMVVGERDQIVQVLQNLIDNALKYSPAGGTVTVAIDSGLTGEAAAEHGSGAAAMTALGGGRLSLVTPDRAVQNSYVLARVTDQGPGMKREHLPRLAERFYRVEGQKSSASTGTGLGLAIVKHIMNRHRGGLLVESAPGHGSTFAVYFPTPAPPT
jgi:two-component system phosphate regulon sensor histidine kinase PhoR